MNLENFLRKTDYILHHIISYASLLILILSLYFAFKIISGTDNKILGILSAILLMLNTVGYFLFSLISTKALKDEQDYKNLGEIQIYAKKLFWPVTIPIILYFVICPLLWDKYLRLKRIVKLSSLTLCLVILNEHNFLFLLYNTFVNILKSNKFLNFYYYFQCYTAIFSVLLYLCSIFYSAALIFMNGIIDSKIVPDIFICAVLIIDFFVFNIIVTVISIHATNNLIQQKTLTKVQKFSSIIYPILTFVLFIFLAYLITIFITH